MSLFHLVDSVLYRAEAAALEPVNDDNVVAYQTWVDWALYSYRLYQDTCPFFYPLPNQHFTAHV